jgi:hypothetical protein
MKAFIRKIKNMGLEFTPGLIISNTQAIGTWGSNMAWEYSFRKLARGSMAYGKKAKNSGGSPNKK